MSGLFADHTGEAIFFSRFDSDHPLASHSNHGFHLEDRFWPSVEHYYQAMQFVSDRDQEKIRTAESPDSATKLGKRTWFKKLRDHWKQQRATWMTRAVYTKCQTHPEVAEALLATGTTKLVENSVYDYYWGCGRDRRGENMYGQVLMNVRDKLRAEQQAPNDSHQGPEATN